MPRSHKIVSQGTKEDEVSYEIGNALHLQPSDTTQRAGLLRLTAVNTGNENLSTKHPKTGELAREIQRRHR